MHDTKKVRVRFAPSPTGSIHIGNLRTALFAWLFTKKEQGSFIVRIEDTDRKRLEEDSLEKIFKTLKWANLGVDEGVYLDKDSKVFQKGDLGPYIQSERLEIYQKYIQELIEQGKVYHCFCSEDRLKDVRQKQQLEKSPIMYDKKCRNLSSEEVTIKIKNGEDYVLRMKIPENEIVEFKDEVFGKISVKTEIIDDQVLMKADGFPTYHFAVVVDDHLMEISHIFRGEDWIPSTPKHVLLYKFFGWEIPSFVHLPNVLGEDKKKLSKRDGSASVEDFVKKGYLPEALVNFLALLGWNPKTEQEIFSSEELIEKFSLEGLNKAGGVFNYQKLDWFNKEYIKLMPEDNFKEKILEFLPAQFRTKVQENLEIFNRLLPIIKERIEKFEDVTKMWEVGDLEYYFKQPNYELEKILWKDEKDLKQTKIYLEEIAKLLNKIDNFEAEEIKSKIWDYATEQGRGSVLWPMRYVLSGKDKSPDPFVLAEILGKGETLNRLQYAIEKIA
ncbi:MAG: glutamate--tRNA ligase [Patescibacteria group bacterium]|nr:glutamate--tRNA ligase [Patescibacteria group bacterium]